MKTAMVSITLSLLLSGCFPSIDQVETKCSQTFNPNEQPDLYVNCVNTRVGDIQMRRQGLAHAFQQAGQSFQHNTVNCETNCNFGTCYTTCR